MKEYSTHERRMLLLRSTLGDQQSAPLSETQYQKLLPLLPDLSDHPTADELQALGLDELFSLRVVNLLSRQRQLDRFLSACQSRGLRVLTRISPELPERLCALRQRAPAVVVLAGDCSLLQGHTIALTGSRELMPSGAQFARTVGRLCAEQDCVLVTGGAPGADHEAILSCLMYGGRVVIFPARPLTEFYEIYEGYILRGNVLLCAEGSASAAFSSARAAARNRLIYQTADLSFVAQAALKTGGTWSGASEALKKGGAMLYVNRDGGPGCLELARLGAAAIYTQQLHEYIRRVDAQKAFAR